MTDLKLNTLLLLFWGASGVTAIFCELVSIRSITPLLYVLTWMALMGLLIGDRIDIKGKMKT